MTTKLSINCSVSTTVADAICLELVGNKPAGINACNAGKICPEWHLSAWKPVSRNIFITLGPLNNRLLFMPGIYSAANCAELENKRVRPLASAKSMAKLRYWEKMNARNRNPKYRRSACCAHAKASTGSHRHGVE